MQGVDNSILNVSLPHVQGSLSASLDQIAWALTSYIVCAAIMMPLTGWLAGRFGIKYIFLASVIGFALQAAMVAYVDDFRLLMLIALAAKPLLLLLREARRRPPPAAVVATTAADD
jgi:DHA2 family multidrug resistance protein